MSWVTMTMVTKKLFPSSATNQIAAFSEYCLLTVKEINKNKSNAFLVFFVVVVVVVFCCLLCQHSATLFKDSYQAI